MIALCFGQLCFTGILGKKNSLKHFATQIYTRNIQDVQNLSAFSTKSIYQNSLTNKAIFKFRNKLNFILENSIGNIKMPIFVKR